MDTDHFAIYQQGTGSECAKLVAKMSARNYENIFVPIISFQEQVMGWNSYLQKSRKSEQIIRAYGRLEAILQDFSAADVIGYDAPAADVFNSLRAQGVRIGTMDLRIASIAKSRDWTVLTRNSIDFSRVPGLKIEDWCQ